MRRTVLIVARTDVQAGLRAELSARVGFDVSAHIAAVRYRRNADAAGSTSHFVAHGAVSESIWGALVDSLTVSTAGVRDSADWQGKDEDPPVDIQNARWAIAYDGGDVVAGFRLSASASTEYEDPAAQLVAIGLVPISRDADDGI